MTGAENVSVQRITAAGDIAPGWSLLGVSTSTDNHTHLYHDITADGEGGAIVAWEDYRSLVNPPYVDIYAQRVTASGTIASGWGADGVRMTGATNGQTNPRVCSDGAGGAFITWQDHRVGSSIPDIYAQHVTGSGAIAPGWPVDGLLINGAAGAQTFPCITADDVGGALIVWRDGIGALVGQRITAAGTVAAGWPAAGVVVCVMPEDQKRHSLAADGAGGAFVAWDDYRGLDEDAYMQRVNGDGTLPAGWPVNGRRVSTATGYQVTTQVAADGLGGGVRGVRALHRGLHGLRAARDRGGNAGAGVDRDRDAAGDAG